MQVNDDMNAQTRPYCSDSDTKVCIGKQYVLIDISREMSGIWCLLGDDKLLPFLQLHAAPGSGDMNSLCRGCTV